MPTLQIIIASTRPGRVGLPVGRWFEGRARAHGGFEVEVVDLAELRLPFVDEPNHPRLRQYTQQHTKMERQGGRRRRVRVCHARVQPRL